MKPILLFLFIALAVKSYSQQPINWQVKIGGTETEYANAVDTSVDGNIFAAGFIRSRTGDYTMQYPNPADPLASDAWIVKYNQFGNILWQKPFGGLATDEFFDVKATPDGGAIAVGRSSSTDGNITGNKGGEDIVVAKYAADGSLQWNKNYGTTFLDGATSVTVMSDGSYVLGCYSNGNNNDLTGNKGLKDIWLIQISNDGAILRKKNFGGTSDDYPYSVKFYNNDTWVITGSTGSINGDVSGNHGSTDVWIIKLDANWTLLKQKCFGGTGQDIGNGVAVLPDGFAIAGRANANNGDVTGLKGSYDGWIVKTDFDLNAVWMKTYGGTSNDWFNTIAVTNDGNLLAAGETSSNNDDITSNAGLSDAWLIKIDPSTGNKLWSKTFGETKADRANDILIWGNDDYLFAGMFTYVIPNTTSAHTQLWIATSKQLAVTGPLPVKLISFEGKPNDKGNFIQWKTSEEINTKEFDIERSDDGTHFNVIGELHATGNSSTEKSYSFTDHQPLSKSWYRLRMIDLDGHEDFSKTITVINSLKEQTSKIFPAVTSGRITVEIHSQKDEKCNLLVYDEEGKLVKQIVLSLSAGINRAAVDLTELGKGTYFAILTRETAKETIKVLRQ